MSQEESKGQPGVMIGWVLALLALILAIFAAIEVTRHLAAGSRPSGVPPLAGAPREQH